MDLSCSHWTPMVTVAKLQNGAFEILRVYSPGALWYSACSWISPSSNHNHSPDPPDPAQMHSSDQVGFLFKNIAHCRSTAVLCNQTVFVTSKSHPLQTDVQAHCSFNRSENRTADFVCVCLLCNAQLRCHLGGALHWLWDPHSTRWRKPLQPLALCLTRVWPATRPIDWSMRIQPETKTRQYKTHTHTVSHTHSVTHTHTVSHTHTMTPWKVPIWDVCAHKAKWWTPRFANIASREW